MRSPTVFLLGAASVLVGCASTPRLDVTGSAAGGALLADAIATVAMVDKMYSADCKQPAVATAEPVATSGQEPETERWRLTRCGKTETYRVSFIPVPPGVPMPKAGRGVAVKRDQ
jgi:hypothetical protein